VRQHRPLFPYFDQAKFGQNPKIIVADRRHFQPAGLDIPQRPRNPMALSSEKSANGLSAIPAD
jgi:hypothetical protein